MANQQVSIYVDEKNLADIDLEAKYLSRSRNWVINQWIENYRLAELPMVRRHREGVPKKIANGSVGDVAQDEVGVSPSLPRGSKAQDTVIIQPSGQASLRIDEGWSPGCVDSIVELGDGEIIPTAAERLAEILKGVKVNVGLKAQGHLPTVERMRAEGKSWDEVGEAIGWAGSAVEEWYGFEVDHEYNCLDQEKNSDTKILSTFGEHGSVSGLVSNSFTLSSEFLKKNAGEEPSGLIAASPEILSHMLQDAKTDESMAKTLYLAGVKLDREVLDRWGLAENSKLKTEETSKSVKWEDLKHKASPERREQLKREALSEYAEMERTNSETTKSDATIDLLLGANTIVRSEWTNLNNIAKEETNGAKGRRKKGASAGVAGGDSEAVETGNDGTKSGEVGDGKPRVDLQALRDICAGKGLGKQEEECPAPLEVDLCGFKSYNEVDGEWYICCKEKHEYPKFKHGEWVKA